MNENDKWSPFHLDTNQAFGLIDSRQEWIRLIEVYGRPGLDPKTPLEARRGKDLPDGTPFFSFQPYCQGETLAEWATEQGMELPIPGSAPSSV